MLKQPETNACRRVVQILTPHTSCDVDEFVMTCTKPEMNMSFMFNLLSQLESYVSILILKIDLLTLIQKSVLYKVNRKV